MLIFSSCLKDITDLNTDPNNPQTVNPELLFKYSVKRGMGNYLTASHLEYTGIQQWVMYFAARGGIEPGNEYPSPSGGDGFWSENYIDAMNNAGVIIIDAESNPDMDNMRAAAIIWKTYIMHRLTDLWGDIPYSEALKGVSELEFTPKYDTQKDIYHAMLNDLEIAVNLFDNSKDFYLAESDLIYAGNIANWIRFANSLRFRLAMRISDAEPDFAASVINVLKQLPLIESNDQVTSFQFNSVFNKPLYEAGSIRYEEGSAYINPSKFLADILVENSDPRIPFLLEKTALSITYPFIDEYRGVPNQVPYNSDIWDGYNLDAQLGDPLGQWGDVSRIGLWYMNNDRPFPIFTYSEICYLKAEAVLDGMWEGDASEYFNEGVRSHMEYINQYPHEGYTISEIKITEYLNLFTDVTLEQVITQKWILFAYENVFEAYADYRRTGFPVLLDYYGNSIDNDIFPRRLRYPYSEYTYNRENYLNAVSIQGPDNELTNIWWDIN